MAYCDGLECCLEIGVWFDIVKLARALTEWIPPLNGIV